MLEVDASSIGLRVLIFRIACIRCCFGLVEDLGML